MLYTADCNADFNNRFNVYYNRKYDINTEVNSVEFDIFKIKICILYFFFHLI